MKAEGRRMKLICQWQQVEQRSITDLEVRHAVLNTKRRSVFRKVDWSNGWSISTPHPNPLPDRGGEGEASDAPATASEYVEPPPLLRKLEQLKNKIRGCGRPVRSYPCEWTGSGFAGMEEFGCRVLDDLWSGRLRDERYVSKVWCMCRAA